MNNIKAKVLNTIVILSKKMALTAEGKQSLFLSFEPNKTSQNQKNKY